MFFRIIKMKYLRSLFYMYFMYLTFFFYLSLSDPPQFKFMNLVTDRSKK